MEIVIKISDKEYEELCGCQYYTFDKHAAYVAMTSGTSLPKHHGRLIDADALEKKMTEYINTLPLTYDEAERIVLLMNHFDEAPTIIEGSDSK